MSREAIAVRVLKVQLESALPRAFEESRLQLSTAFCDARGFVLMRIPVAIALATLGFTTSAAQSNPVATSGDSLSVGCFAFQQLDARPEWYRWLVLDTAPPVIHRYGPPRNPLGRRAVLLGGIPGRFKTSWTSWLPRSPDSIYVRSEVIPLPSYHLVPTAVGFAGEAEMITDVIERDSLGRPYSPIARWPVALQTVPCDSVPEHRDPSQN